MFPLNSISYETKIIIKKILVNRKAEIKYLLKRKKEKNPNKSLVYREIREFDLNKYYFECILSCGSYQAESFYFCMAIRFKMKADWLLSVDVYQEFLESLVVLADLFLQVNI